MTHRESKLLDNDVVLAGIFLDPRFKVVLNIDEMERAKSHLKQLWARLLSLKKIASEDTENEDPDAQTMMDRKTRILKKALSDGDKTTMRYLQIPKYESTKGLDTNEIENLLKTIVKTLNVDSTRNSAEPKKVIPRLKQAQYGEILTTAEVIERLKEAERQKEEKASRQCKFRSKKISNEKQKGKRKQDIGSEEEHEVVPYDENSDGEINADEWAEEVVAENYPEVEYELPEWPSIQPGMYLLVKSLGGSRNSITYKYVCRVRDVDEETGDIEVVGFRRNDRFGAEYVEKENDISSIDFGMIEAVPPDPETSYRDRKVIHIFPGSVSVFEK
ncbi:unnamed protein product [Phaedon cochleariae]|uniref:Uncharacterized protein n=1 Tax=Phaedon cochleariae TaxID=80249 RepID=A0A9N9SHW6_PHACE|nr:unnamed protein product [Phaedon cochleariae]